MSNARDVTDSTFEQDVLRSDKPVIVDFWADWCGPCRMVSPVLDQIAAEHAGKVNVVKVNIDENPWVAAEFGITSIPAIYLFKDGASNPRWSAPGPSNTWRRNSRSTCTDCAPRRPHA